MRFLLALTLLFLALPVAAQDDVVQLDALTVELWPDYDRPSMLVLLTGTLPAAATLPATVSIPLPDAAEIHAIARFTEDSVLISDVVSSEADGQLMLTTPGRVFRVEYYMPYEREGSETSFRFEWVSDLAVESAGVIIQQPIAATDFTIVPEPNGSAADRGDGLNYHRIDPRPLAAGEPLTVEVRYTVDTPLLSAPSQQVPAATATPEANGALLGEFSPWWLVAIPLVLALLVGAWYVGRRTGSGRPHKPRPARRTDSGTTRAASGFCHQCGQPAQSGDAFCRKCGTRLKR